MALFLSAGREISLGVTHTVRYKNPCQWIEWTEAVTWGSVSPECTGYTSTHRSQIFPPLELSIRAREFQPTLKEGSKKNLPARGPTGTIPGNAHSASTLTRICFAPYTT